MTQDQWNEAWDRGYQAGIVAAMEMLDLLKDNSHAYQMDRLADMYDSLNEARNLKP
jgi:hypothetical protein